MRKIVYLLITLPLLGFSQSDFETRYFTINATSLPEMENLTSISLENTPNFIKKLKLPTFSMNKENYRVPVTMSEVLEKRQQFVTKKWNGSPRAKQKALSFSVSVNGNNSRRSRSSFGVENTVYQEQRPFFFCSPLDIYTVNQ